MHRFSGQIPSPFEGYSFGRNSGRDNGCGQSNYSYDNMNYGANDWNNGRCRGRGRGRGRGRDYEHGQDRCFTPTEYQNQNQYRKYPHQNPDVVPIKHETNYGKELCDKLIGFTTMDNLIVDIKNTISKLSTPREKAGILGAILENAIHEVFTDKILYHELFDSYDTEYEKLPKAIWATMWYRPYIKRKFTKFSRDNNDVAQTVKLCLEIGSNPLEVNKHGENAFISLAKCHEQLQCNGMTYECYTRIYNIMCTPIPGNKNAICSRICNTLSGGKTQQTSPNVKWIMTTLPEEFCKAIANNLMLTPETAKINQIYTYTRQHLLLIKNMLEDDNLGHFEKFFKDKQFTADYLVDKFARTIVRYCTTTGIYSKDIFSGNSFNKEVAGAIVGEIGSNTEFLEFCRIHIPETIKAVITALYHRKTNKPEFKCPNDIIDTFIAHYHGQPGFIKFSIIACLELFTDSSYVREKIVLLTGKQEGNTIIVKPVVIATISATTTNTTNIINAANDTSITDTTISSSTNLYADFTIESIKLLNSEAVYSEYDKKFNFDYLDDIVYGFNVRQNDFGNKMFLKIVLVRILETLRNKEQIDCIKKILEITCLLNVILEFARNNGENMLDAIDNPRKNFILEELLRI